MQRCAHETAPRARRLFIIGDPFLNYFALGILVFVVIVIFYGIIAIHDIPHIIAKSRDHSHQDAIHAAGSSGARLVSPLGHLD